MQPKCFNSRFRASPTWGVLLPTPMPTLTSFLCPLFQTDPEHRQLNGQPRGKKYTTHVCTRTHTFNPFLQLPFYTLNSNKRGGRQRERERERQRQRHRERRKPGFLLPTIRNNYHFPQASRAAFPFDACLKEMEGGQGKGWIAFL